MAENRIRIIIEALTRGMDELDDASARVQRLGTAAVAVGGAITALATAVYGAAQSIQKATNDIAAALNVGAAEAERLGNVAKNIYGDNLAASVEEAAQVVIEAMRNMSGVSEEEIQKVGKQALMLRDAFGVDTAESISTARTLMENFGMTADAAMDLITAGYQKGLNRSGDFLDSLNEYAPQFKEAGLDASQFFSVIQTGLQGGVMGTDKAGDLMKEFRLRILDGSETTSKALQQIGVDVDAMLAGLADGSMQAGDAFQEVIGQMRGVEDQSTLMQAGVALMGTQFEDMGQEAVLALDITRTKMDELSGASEKLKVQYNDIGSIISGVWRKAQMGLFKLVDLINWGIKTFQDMDASAQTLTATLGAYAGIFILWKAGLGALVIGIKKVILDMWALRAAAVETQVAIGGLQAQFMAASLAMKAGLIIAIVWSGVKVYEAVKAFLEMRDAQEMAAAASQRVMDSTDRVMAKYAEFKNVDIPDNLTGAAQDDLDHFDAALRKSRAYWMNLKIALEEKSRQTNIFGNLTDEAEAAKGQLTDVNAKLESVFADMARVREAGAGAGDAMQKTADQAFAAADSVAAFAEAAEKAYQDAAKAAAEYAKEAIAWQEKIDAARLSTEDKIRSLGRKAMTDENAWADERLQAEQKLSAAKEALKQKDYEQAEKLAKQAEGLYANLAREVKAGEGRDAAVVKTIEQTKDVAVAGVSAVGQFIEGVYAEQRDAAKGMRDNYIAAAELMKTELDELAKDRKAKVQIVAENLEQVQKEFNALVADAKKQITVEIKTVEKKAAGGPVGLARGGRLAGYGGGDQVPAVLERGEFVIRKEAVRRYGEGLFSLLNALRLPGGLPKIPMPTMPAVPRVAYATGGPVSGGLDLKHLGQVDITMGNGNAYPMIGKIDVIKELKTALKREQLMKTR